MWLTFLSSSYFGNVLYSLYTQEKALYTILVFFNVETSMQWMIKVRLTLAARVKIIRKQSTDGAFGS